MLFLYVFVAVFHQGDNVTMSHKGAPYNGKGKGKGKDEGPAGNRQGASVELICTKRYKGTG